MDNVTEDPAPKPEAAVEAASAVKAEFPRKVHEGSTPRLYGYSVQARFYGHTNGQSKRVNDNFTLTATWQNIPFETSNVGVPAQHWGLDRHLAIVNLMSYDAAQALRWWFLASLNAQPLGSLCVETRLIQHEVRVNWTSTATRVCDAFLGDETRYQAIPRPEVK